jgi:transcriptional regulator with XRE-family HTH domain
MASVQQVRYCGGCGTRLARDNRSNRCAGCSHVARDSLLRPPSVPRQFWDTDQMRDALNTWHVGRVIFAYRTHPWHPRPLSQEIVGNWLGLTQAQLSRIENGRAPEELTKLVAWAQILGIPGELLWFKLPDEADANTPAPGESPQRLTLPVLLHGRSILLPIDTHAARESGLDGLLDELAGGQQAPSDSLAHALPTRDLDELEHVAAALDDARRYLDGSVVGYFHEQLGRSKADDGSHGPAKALPLVLGILGAISEHVREVQPGVRRALLSLGADGAEFVGWLYRDLQDPANATYWYDRAMEWAQEAGDTAMQGYVLLKKSQMAYDRRDAFRVVTLAQAAGQGAWHLPGKVQAEALESEAIGLAMLGEPLGVVERKMDEASALLLNVRPDGKHDGPAGAYFTTDTLLLRQAACYTEAGKPAKAAVLFDDVIARNGLSRRDAGFFRARRAAALALSGEPDEAAAVGLEAVQVAQDIRSERTMRVLADVVTTLSPWRTRPGPRALIQALATSQR